MGWEREEAAVRAHRGALRGDFAPFAVLARQHPAWSACLDELAWLAGVRAEPPPEAALASVGADAAARAAWGHRALASFLRLDAGGVDRAERALRKAGDDLGARRAEALGRVLQGNAEPGALEALRKDAAAAGRGEIATESAALGALGRLERGALDDAVSSARRAARMARAEGVVQQEYLASVVLARVRRACGASHLAARILTALADVAPRAWARLLDWELAFAGAAGRVGEAGASVERVLRTARAGSRSDLGDAAAALEGLAGDAAFARRDVERLLDVVDPARDGGGDLDAVRSCAAIEARFGAHDAPAYVAAAPGRAARRILASGIALLDAAGALTIGRAGRRDARVLLLLTALALAGPAGATEADVFREAYGFGFVREKHDGTFRVLIHRARATLDGHATLQRDAGAIALRVLRPLLIPDPRCAQRLEERVMHYLGARGGPASAKEVAAGLGVSVRAAQRALRELAEEGACRVEPGGGAARFALEDTTFLEPTRSRVVATPASR